METSLQLRMSAFNHTNALSGRRALRLGAAGGAVDTFVGCRMTARVPAGCAPFCRGWLGSGPPAAMVVVVVATHHCAQEGCELGCDPV